MINNTKCTYLKRFLHKDSETDEPHFKIEKAIARMKSIEQYKFNLHMEIDRINSNTKEDQSTS